METNIIYNEDCLVTLSRMEDNTVDSIVTSPPYNKGWYAAISGNKCEAWSRLGEGGKIPYDKYDDAMLPEEYEKWQREILKECIRVLKPEGSIFYNHKDILFNGLSVVPKWVYDFPLRQQIIWQRPGSPQISDRYFMPVTEYIYWIVKNPQKVFFDKEKAKYKMNVWRMGFEKNPHPAPFPKELAMCCISSTSQGGGIIYDPFMGSGTTAICTLEAGEGRRFIGSEISENYVKMANERIRLWLSEPKMF